MIHPTGWPTAQSICDIPEVRAALDAFAQDANEENMLAMVSAIMGHANDIAASANEEQSALVDKLQEALAFWLPSMPMRMGMEEMASRIEHDSWLLVGASGELSPGAEESGWIVKVEPDASPASVRAAALEKARDALEEIALAGMSGSGHESPEGLRDWHARRAWEFIGIAARAKTEIDSALSAAPAGGLGDGNEDKWYLQDTRSYVGNDVMWWAKDGKGYTTDVSKAHVYDRDAAFRQAAMRGTDRAWPKAYIDGKTRPAVDMQYINHEEAIAAAQGEGK